MRGPPALTVKNPVRGALVLLLGLLTISCDRPRGDFGRYAPSLLHDHVLPVVGEMVAGARREPVSFFPLTDNERLLQNLAEGLVEPPHEKDWATANMVELQRLRITPVADFTFDPRKYEQLLLSDAYASSDTRYARVMSDMQADASLIDPFSQAARAVRADDDFRMGALSRTRDLGAHELTEAWGRMDENSKTIAWVWRALRFRLRAYQFAIERLEFKTPSAPQSEAAYLAWKALKEAVDQADFATALGKPLPGGLPRPDPSRPWDGTVPARPSRMMNPPSPPDELPPRK